MDYYEKNLATIKKHRSDMYQSIEKTDINKTSNRLDDIKSAEARDGQLALSIRYHQIDYRLNSPFNPTQEAGRWVEQFSFHSINNVIAMYGFGNGVFARAIISRINKSDTLIIYEPCAELFFHVLRYYDISDLLSNPNLVVSIEGVNDFEFHNMLRAKTSIINIKNIIKCTYPNYDRIFPESNLIFWKEMRDSHTTAVIQTNTTIRFREVTVENILKNLPHLLGSSTIFELKDSLPKDIPAIVVAAGPSVADQIEILKKAKGRAVIVAVDRILDYLLDSEVIPDLIFTLDPIKPVEYFSNRDNINIPLLSFLASNHQIYEIHKGKKIICNCSGFLIPFYKEIGKEAPMLMSSGSVATAAFTACVALGFENIILVGQDLAFKGDATHAGGIEEKISYANEIMVEGVEGHPVKSRYDWKEYLIWYEDFLMVYPHINAIDTKSSGARIKGTKLMSLDEALERYSFGEKNFVLKPELLSEAISEKDIEKLIIYLKKGLDQLEILERKAKEASKLCDRMISDCRKNIHAKAIDKNHSKLTKINGLIEEQDIYLLMNNYVNAVSTHKLATIYQFKNDLKEDSISTYLNSKSIYEAIVEAVDIVRPLLGQVIEEFESTI